MPLTIRDKNSILDSLLSSLLAGNIVNDVAQISVVRQLCEAIAAEEADRAYDLYTLLQGFYISTATDVDLDARGHDMGLVRDAGQAASGPVVFTAALPWVEDIPLPAPQVVQATLADGTQVLYHSLRDATLAPSGRSISGTAPGTSVTSGVNDAVTLNLDGDGVRTVSLGTQTSSGGIAAALQAAVRALAALNPANQPAYSGFRCDFSVTTAGAYTLRSGTAGVSSTVVVTPSGSADASVTLKLGLAHGGLEQAGQASLNVPVLCDTIGVLGNVAAGQINQQTAPVAGVDHVANPLAFSNGREPASDDAYRQDVRSYILALGRGTRDAMERAVYATVGSDGQKHVLSAQLIDGAGNTAVYVCDGRSLTVGAQSDTVADVQDELDGLGSTAGGWVATGNTAGVAAASVLQVAIDVQVLVGPTPDLARAKAAITNALYQLLYAWPVGQFISYQVLAGRIDDTVAEVLNVTFTLPAAFSTTPMSTVGGAVGSKIMPGTLAVTVLRA